MKCPKCGQENKDSAKTCSKCSAALKPKASSDTTASFIPPTQEEKAVIKVKPQKEPALVAARGPVVGERFCLVKKEITLGRDPGSDIFLNDITVSRNHAKIKLGSDKVVITDVGSLNGTYLNSERVEKAVLKHGDEVQIGKFKLVFLGKRNQSIKKG